MTTPDRAARTRWCSGAPAAHHPAVPETGHFLRIREVFKGFLWSDRPSVFLVAANVVLFAVIIADMVLKPSL